MQIAAAAAAIAAAVDLPELPSLIGIHGAIIAPDATTFEVVIAVAMINAG